MLAKCRTNSITPWYTSPDQRGKNKQKSNRKYNRTLTLTRKTSTWYQKDTYSYNSISYPSVFPHDACGVIPPHQLCQCCWGTCTILEYMSQSTRKSAKRMKLGTSGRESWTKSVCSESKSGRVAPKLTDQGHKLINFHQGTNANLLDYQEANMWTLLHQQSS